jgi:hypothetical protein
VSLGRSLAGALALGIAALPACAKDVGPARDLPPDEAPLGRAEARVRAVEARAGWEILSFASDGAVLYGFRQGAPPASDARVTYEARALAPGAKVPVSLGGARLFDAALSPAGDVTAYVTSPGGELWLAARGVEPHPVAEDVSPGLAFSRDGRALAYARGERPELDVYWVDVATGRETRLSDDPAPDYLPAFSDDGARIAFVSARGGRPRLWIAPKGGGPAAPLAGDGPVPDGREAPLWASGLVVFSDGRSVHARAEDTGEVVLGEAGASRPHWLSPGEVAYRSGASEGAYRALRIAGGRP